MIGLESGQGPPEPRAPRDVDDDAGFEEYHEARRNDDEDRVWVVCQTPEGAYLAIRALEVDPEWTVIVGGLTRDAADYEKEILREAYDAKHGQDASLVALGELLVREAS